MTYHTIVSYIKSGIRIMAFGLLTRGDLLSSGLLLILAEVLGIAEEWF